jgi:hypothetical protein
MHQRHGDPGATDRDLARTLPTRHPRSRPDRGSVLERFSAPPRQHSHSGLEDVRTCWGAHTLQSEAL